MLLALTATPPSVAQTCPGDCGGDGSVAINELIVGVNIALGALPVSACAAFDRNGDEQVLINEVIDAVNRALNGCTAPVSAVGICQHPGPGGLEPCRAGVVVRALRCDDPVQCLDGTSGITVIDIGAIGTNGQFTLSLERTSVTGALLVFQADVDPEHATNYRVMDLGPSGSRIGSAGGAQPASLEDIVVSPATEAAVRLLNEAGLENFDGDGVLAVTDAVIAATADLDFAGLTAAAAADLAEETARQDPAVQSVLASHRFTPTPTPTATDGVPTATPTTTFTATAVASSTRTHTASPTLTPTIVTPSPTLPADGDSDGDGLTNAEEVTVGADGYVTDPLDADTDGDGSGDGVESQLLTDPTSGTPDDAIIDGRPVLLAGRARLRSLTLRNGAVLGHPPATSTKTFELSLEVMEMLAIDASSRIDTTGQGFLGGHAGDNTSENGRTAGNTTVGGSTGLSGGGHGGIGGRIDGASNAPYGDYRDPSVPGSGGAGDCGRGSGGGVVRISAGTLALDGAVRGDGDSGDTCGGGGGGAITIAVDTLAGAGRISANGGDGSTSFSAGGGGGRVAVFYAQLSAFNLANIEALPGTGVQPGGAGTLFIQRNGELGELLVRGSGGETPLAEGVNGDHVVIDAATVSVQSCRPATMILRNGAVLTHPRATASTVPYLEVTTSTLTVDATSRIDVSGRGYLGGRAGDNASEVGRTLGNSTTGGSTGASGGSYGGPGGDSPDARASNAVYGDFRDPNEPGSGGAGTCGRGTGGGLVRIDADMVVLDGEIRADGDTGNTCGGGSGGGIGLTVDTLAGGGRIRADGGLSSSGGGGGGRVAIRYETSLSFGLDRVQANGGLGTAVGGVGTIFVRDVDGQQFGELRIDARDQEPGRETPLYALGGGSSTALEANSLVDAAASFIPGALIGLRLRPDRTLEQTFRVIANDETTLFTDPADGAMTAVAASGATYAGQPVLDRLVVINRAQVEVLDANRNLADRRGALTASTLALSGGARLTHPPASSQSRFGLELSVPGILTIDSTSAIDVSGRGYLGAGRGDNPGDAGLTVENIPGSTGRNGGSYGGVGGTVAFPGMTNGVYGDARDPNEPGSGGAATDCANLGGSGGGLVRIVAATADVDGLVAADGGDANGCAGAGSGGAIKLTADTLQGSGTIRANGGSASGSFAGGGGGGRVAVLRGSASGFDGILEAEGGSGLANGQSGTVVSEEP
jgi:hypothetical protein